MQQQGQIPMLTPMQAQLPPTNNISTDVIQKYLDENKQLILAILDNQNLGKLAECAQYQARLQNNLLYLAAIADAQPQIAAPRPQMPIQQGVQYMQPQPNFSPRGSQQFYPQQFQEQAPHNQMNHSQMLPSQAHMHAISNGACVTHAEGVLVGSSSSGGGGNLPPASSLHEFAHGGSADGQAGASVLETASLEGQRSSASQQKTGDVENT